MRLSDVMSNMGLTSFAEIALVLFFLVFVGIVIYTFLRRNRKKYQEASMLPLEDDDPGEIDQDHETTRGGGRGDAS
jgi:cbb3-type cytochrome oxidase subunit 3